MFSDAYTTIENEAATALIEKLNVKLDQKFLDLSNIRVLSHSLPFYNGYNLCEVSDFDNTPPRLVSFIDKEGGDNDDLYVLDGTNEPIYFLNNHVPIFLDSSNIITYVQFFFHYVRGRFGRFHIVENVDEINWREEPAPAGRRALAKMIQTLEIKNNQDDDHYYVSASIIFKDSLFESDIIVKQNGEVSLNNQEMLVEDIPVLDDSFQQ